ncbi:MAG: ROK family protein [Ignavibacteria bacterium]|nr:ROK family protein [Ignavibacteria bacterium]
MTKHDKAVIGIDLGGTSIKFGLVSAEGNILAKVSRPSNASQGPDAVIEQIKSGVHELLKDDVRVKGIGIGAPGIVNAKKGIVENPPNLPGWGKICVSKILEKEFDKKIFVENDANAAAIGEMVFGAGKDLTSFLMVTLGTGVGGGIVIKKKIFRGDSGAAGEFGHMTIDFNGPKCNCGSRGCIEAYLGINYLTQHVASDLGRHSSSKIFELIDYNLDNLTPLIISKAAKAGDEYAISVITDAGTKLGYAISSVCNLLDITSIIVGGGVAGFGQLLFDSAKASAKERVLKSLRDKITILPAKLSNEAGILGASSLVVYND